MGSHYVAYVGLKLLGSSIPPASASQVAEIIGTCHHIWLEGFFVLFCFFMVLGFELRPLHLLGKHSTT
jgi:hypothetical protein